MNYIAKAKDSFRTKFNIYLFKHLIEGQNSPITFESFRDYKIEASIVQIHTTQYYQLTADKTINGIMIRDLEQQIIAWKKDNASEIKGLESRYVKEVFPEEFPKGDFDRIAAISQCYYCSITIEQINLLID